MSYCHSSGHCGFTKLNCCMVSMGLVLPWGTCHLLFCLRPQAMGHIPLGQKKDFVLRSAITSRPTRAGSIFLSFFQKYLLHLLQALTWSWFNHGKSFRSDFGGVLPLSLTGISAVPLFPFPALLLFCFTLAHNKSTGDLWPPLLRTTRFILVFWWYLSRRLLWQQDYWQGSWCCSRGSLIWMTLPESAGLRCLVENASDLGSALPSTLTISPQADLKSWSVIFGKAARMGTAYLCLGTDKHAHTP